MRKKIVWLPYDMDTALGINNEGSLTFGYSLEDTDNISGENVFNGQDSVMWNNLREMFADEIKEMYQQMRSSGKLSYQKVEEMFEEHQDKWPEAIFNEDAKYKYLDPLENDNDATYLPMLQGSKAEQRKWWLYNRFRYMDSKYNSGDALTDYIQLRGYAKADISVTPYADIYPTIKYGSYVVSTRGERNNTYTLECPLDTVNDTEIYIYSASALSGIGDISGLKVGLADFSKAIKLTAIKIGDGSEQYDNPNLKSLTLGNNTLLTSIDVRNCSGLGTGSQRNVDLSGCTGLETCRFDGTAIAGLELPNGGSLRVLHLPGTVTNLTIRNQTALSDFVCPDFSHVTTLWLENPSAAIDTLEIMEAMPTGGRVRLFNFHWTVDDLREILPLFEKLDTMRGLDQNGNNVNTAQVYGTIHAGLAAQGLIDSIRARYPDVTITYDTVMPSVTYKSSDGQTTIMMEYVTPGGNGTKLLPDDKAQTAQYVYTPAGWSATAGGQPVADILQNITQDKIVYAVYTITTRTYSITFRRGADDGNDVLQTVLVPYGQTPEYPGASPASTRGIMYAFAGWNPALAAVTGDAVYTAVFMDPVTVTFRDYDGTVLDTVTGRWRTSFSYPGSDPQRTATAQYSFTFAGWSATQGGNADSLILSNVTETKSVYAAYAQTIRSYTITFVKATADGGGTLQTSTVQYGTLPVFSGEEPTSTRGVKYAFDGWDPVVAAVTENKTYTAKFRNTDAITRQLIDRSIEEFESNIVTNVSERAFYYCDSLKTLSLPEATNIDDGGVDNIYSLSHIYIPKVTTLGASCLRLSNVNIKDYLVSITLPSVTLIKRYAFEGRNELKEIIISNTESVAVLEDASAIPNYTNTFVYVPDELLSSYKESTNWAHIAERIKPISELAA